MPLAISHHLLNVFVQLANKRGLKKIYIARNLIIYTRYLVLLNYQLLRGSDRVNIQLCWGVMKCKQHFLSETSLETEISEE
jgi:hypothetical protein